MLPLRFLLRTLPLAAVLLVAPARADADADADADAHAHAHKIEAPIHESHLTNGLTVVIQADHRAPLVGVNVRYKAGSANDPPERHGLALLLQYAMQDATKHVASGDYERLLTRAGGTELNRGTNFDYTRFSIVIPVNRLDLALWILSDQMGFFAERLDAPLLAKAALAVETERRQRIESEPLGNVGWMMREALYGPKHPYAGTFYGKAHELDGVSVDEVTRFYDAYFGPEQAIVTLVGDVDEEKAMALVRKYFEPIPRGLAIPKLAPPLPLTASKRLLVRANVPHPVVHIAWSVPPTFADGDAQLELAARLLDGNASAPLAWALVDRMKIATKVSASMDHRKMGSLFEIAATAADGHTAEELLTAIDDVLASFVAHPPSGNAVAIAAVEELRPRLFDLERYGAHANMLARYVDGVGKADFFDEDIAHHRLEGAQVAAAVARYLPRDRRVVAIVQPSPDAPVAGELTSVEEAR